MELKQFTAAILCLSCICGCAGSDADNGITKPESISPPPSAADFSSASSVAADQADTTDHSDQVAPTQRVDQQNPPRNVTTRPSRVSKTIPIPDE